MWILGIDPAGYGTSGIAIKTPYKKWLFTSKKNKNSYNSFVWVRQIISSFPFKVVVIEDYLPFRQITNSAFGVISMLEAFCLDKKIKFIKYHPKIKNKWLKKIKLKKISFQNKHERDAWIICQEYIFTTNKTFFNALTFYERL